MKNAKLYKWLTVTLMLSISVFCLLYLEKTQKSTTPTDASAKNEIAVPDKPETPVFYNELPRSAYTYNGEILQNVGGDGEDEIRNVHTFNKTNYVFCDTSSNGYDVKTTVPSVFCAALDDDLTLKKTLTFSSGKPEKYIASKISRDGFFVMTKSEAYVALYKMNFDLVVTQKVVFDGATDGALYFLSNGNILPITTNGKQLSVRVLNDDATVKKTSSLFFDNAEIVSAYEIDETLNLFLNTENGFARIGFSDAYGFVTSDEYPSKKLVDILPYNGGFAGIYLENGQNVVFTADVGLKFTNVKNIGSPEFARLFKSGKNLVSVTTENEKSTLSLYCNHLDEVLSSSRGEILAVPFFDESTSLIALHDGKRTNLYSFDALTFTLIASFPSSPDFLKVLQNGIVAFSTNEKDDAFNKNFGKSDVFLTKKNID